MTQHPASLRHNALVYESQEEYLACAVPFLREGIEAGEGAIVAHTKRGLAMMRESLGPDAAHVTFVDVSAAYTRPAQTLAAYHTIYVEQLQSTPALRAVADVQFGPDPAEWDLWIGYEAVFNRSFGHLPAWVLCSYDANGIPDPVIEGLWQTHSDVLADEKWSASDRFEDPDRVLREVTPTPAPLAGLRSVRFGRDLEELRERVACELVVHGLSPERSLDMLLAVTEVGANAVTHGGGIVDVRLGPVGGRFVCEIVDGGGGFDDPAAGYLPPLDGAGTGLWVARQLTRRIEFFHAPGGFTARIWL